MSRIQAEEKDERASSQTQTIIDSLAFSLAEINQGPDESVDDADLKSKFASIVE